MRRFGCTTRSMQIIPYFKTKQNKTFSKTLSPRQLLQNSLHKNIRNSSNLKSFRNSIVTFIGLSANRSIFNSHNPKGIKFILRQRLRLSHLRERKFKYSFQDLLKPICNCGLDIKSTLHYLLHCPTYNTGKHILLSTLEDVDNNLTDLAELILIETLLLSSNPNIANANY